MHVLFLLLAMIASYSAPVIDNQPVFRTTEDGTLLTVMPPPEEP